ncbi:tetratricopeptide repeat protein [Catenulispora subtropica]|uniref:Tetratricopeptide TPR_2 repeat protein n=1 Tax=Catenulispora subtropica TaxID=450798 RepID=A0ABN2SYR9_9ACTN
MTGQAEHVRLLERAQTLLGLRRFGEAETVLRQVLASAPDDAVAMRLLAAALNDSGRPAEALPVIKSAVALAPDAPVMYAVLSTIERANGDADAAAAAADRAIELAPHWPAGHARRAWALADRNPVAALDAARRAVELAPGQADGHFVLGYAALRAGKPMEAERAFRATLAVDPNHSMAINNLAVLEIRRKNFRGALAGFRGAVSTDPRNKTAATNFEAIGRNVVQSRLRWVVAVSILFLSSWTAAGSSTDLDANAVRRRFVAVAAYGLWWAVLAAGLRLVPRGQVRLLLRLSARGSSAPACVAMGAALVLPVAGAALGWAGVVDGAFVAAVATIVVRSYYVMRYYAQRARGSHSGSGSHSG